MNFFRLSDAIQEKQHQLLSQASSASATSTTHGHPQQQQIALQPMTKPVLLREQQQPRRVDKELMEFGEVQWTQVRRELHDS
jgi:hypothetical protein